jgi:uncharacterized protein (DUF983 family)
MSVTHDTNPLRLRVLRRVLTSRTCPQCGTGRLFRSWAKLEERCASCGLVYRREPGSMTGSMYSTAVVTEIFAALLIGLAWVLTDWSTAVFIAVAVPLVLVFSALVLPLCQAFWVGIEYLTDVGNGESWIRPR